MRLPQPALPAPSDLVHKLKFGNQFAPGACSARILPVEPEPGTASSQNGGGLEIAAGIRHYNKTSLRRSNSLTHRNRHERLST